MIVFNSWNCISLFSDRGLWSNLYQNAVCPFVDDLRNEKKIKRVVLLPNFRRGDCLTLCVEPARQQEARQILRAADTHFKNYFSSHSSSTTEEPLAVDHGFFIHFPKNSIQYNVRLSEKPYRMSLATSVIVAEFIDRINRIVCLLLGENKFADIYTVARYVVQLQLLLLIASGTERDEARVAWKSFFDKYMKSQSVSEDLVREVRSQCEPWLPWEDPSAEAKAWGEFIRQLRETMALCLKHDTKTQESMQATKQETQVVEDWTLLLINHLFSLFGFDCETQRVMLS